MLYYILYPLAKKYIVFNLFRYITFRLAMAATTSFLVSVFLCSPLIKYLKKRHWVTKIREDVPQRHQGKKGTPTMGGLVIIAGVLMGTILWAKIGNPYIILSLVSVVLAGAMGFIDDYLKDVKHKPKGLLARYKLYGQFILAFAISIMIYLYPLKTPSGLDLRTITEVPFLKNLYINMGIGYILFTMLVIVGASNAVNLSDGLDGLAAGLVGILAATFTVVAYVSGRQDFTAYLNIIYLPGSGELSIFCASMAGAILGFLWYNSYPAEIFMGDTGALSMGAALGVVAVILKKEFMLLIAGFVLVAEALSVILQVIHFKRTGGKRLFRMAPIHHHFELMGWAEPKIVVRFWILGIIFAVLGLVSFKVR